MQGWLSASSAPAEEADRQGNNRLHRGRRSSVDGSDDGGADIRTTTGRRPPWKQANTLRSTAPERRAAASGG